jgi:protein ImuA
LSKVSGVIAEEALDVLRRRIAVLERGGVAACHEVLPFGVAAVDAALPGGGLALGALHELRGAARDEEDGAVVAGFLAGILARLGPPRPVLWCLAEADLYGPGLAACGLTPERLVLVRGTSDAERLWAMEEGLRTKGLAAVVGEAGQVGDRASRRLQLAAEATGVTAFLLRRWRNGGSAAAARTAPLAATTRWRVAALPGELNRGEPGVGRPRWRVELLRCRGGVPAAWVMEACDATGHVSLAPQLADRPAPPPRQLQGFPAGQQLGQQLERKRASG